jgi:hypothetical protein
LLPKHTKALWLKASLEHEQGHYADALETWKRCFALLPPGIERCAHRQGECSPKRRVSRRARRLAATGQPGEGPEHRSGRWSDRDTCSRSSRSHCWRSAGFTPPSTTSRRNPVHGYALGIAGGSAMLLLLLYPARKRVPRLAFLGSTRRWFQIHMVLGIAGPLLVLFHSNFTLGATNSNVALFCHARRSGQRVFGRYFYAQSITVSTAARRRLRS